MKITKTVSEVIGFFARLGLELNGHSTVSRELATKIAGISRVEVVTKPLELAGALIPCEDTNGWMLNEEKYQHLIAAPRDSPDRASLHEEIKNSLKVLARNDDCTTHELRN